MHAQRTQLHASLLPRYPRATKQLPTEPFDPI
jgi:hypothetical protein